MKKSAITLATVVFLLAILFSQAAFAQDAAALYKSKMCAACHGPDGNGKTPLTGDIQKKSDAELAKAIADGVPPKMPGYKAKGLTDDQIKELVAYVRSLKK